MTVNDEILEIIREMPNISSNEIAELISQPKQVHWRLRDLESKGLVTKTGRKPMKIGVCVRQISTYGIANGKPKPKVWKSCEIERKPVVAELREEIEELKRWRADAIARYPDLAIDPVVLEARKIVAKIFEHQGDKIQAEHVMRGLLDEKPIMLATVMALGGK